MEPCDGISINLRSYIVRTNRMPHQPTLYTHHVKQKSICPVKSHWNLWTVCYHYITWSLLTDTQPKPNHYLSFSWKIRVILNISFPLPLVNWFPSIFLPSVQFSRSVVSDSVRPHRRQPTRLPRPWDSPGKNTGVGCHFLLQCMKVKSESEVA